jgi:hypothetical protein
MLEVVPQQKFSAALIRDQGNRPMNTPIDLATMA